MNRRREWFFKETKSQPGRFTDTRVPRRSQTMFSIIDRNFQAADITTNSIKFGYSLTVIGPRYTLEVRDIIMKPPVVNAYQTLRTELIERISLSQEHKTRQLLEHEEIGDWKPSQFLRHLRGFAGNVVGDGVLRTIWLSRLLTHVKPYLVTRANDTIDQLVDIADAIMEATSSTNLSHGSYSPHCFPYRYINLPIAQMQMQQRELLEQITTLQNTIKTMRLSDRGRDHRRRSRSRSRSTNRGKIGTCWYHSTFEQAAQKC